ncbi:MAG: DUF1566 domain-containing protein [Spirochaetia bacterium]|nr:DUF1566 domain-containing protein [Spirochaetia bacterium]
MISSLRNRARVPLLLIGAISLIALLDSCKTVPGCPTSFCNYKEDLTLYGRNVRLLFEDSFKAAGGNCSFRAELNTGAYVPGTNQEAITILRNMAGEIGANTVVMQSYNRDKDAVGRAYVCDGQATQISNHTQPATTSQNTSVSNTINTTSSQNTSANTSASTSTGPSSFPQSAAGASVTDTGKRLSWQTCSMGQSYQNGKCTGQATAESLQTAASYCNQMSSAGYTYRLPDRNELVSVLKEGSAVKVDPRVFPDTKADIYWTRESYNGSPITNWVVDFGGGGSFGYGTENQAYVRCVANLP